MPQTRSGWQCGVKKRLPRQAHEKRRTRSGGIDGIHLIIKPYVAAERLLIESSPAARHNNGININGGASGAQSSVIT